MKRYLVCLALLLLAAGRPAWSMTEAERRQYLGKLLQTLPDVPSFNQWLQKTGEIPPDFDAFPKVNALPDPLKFLDGRPVRTAAEWRLRRAEIRQLFEKYDLGTFPPKPKLDRVVPLDETPGKGYTVRNVRLEYGPGSKGTTRVQVMIPDGRGPFPVLISPNLAGWAPSLLRRGYISCGYAGNDGMDDEAALAGVYPEYDFAALPRRAWAAGMVLDYLATLPQVDMKHVAMFGYSRDGKMAAIATATDERIAAVIAGSTGVGGLLPWRLSGERGYGEGIESTTRSFPTWFVPRLRFFSGREDRLPVDGNLLAATIAPRAALIEYGLNDEVSNSWALEQVYHSAMEVYTLLGQPGRLGLLRVPGFHGANDQEACLDWLDIQFGRSTRTWDNHLLFPWDFDKWRANSKVTVDLTRYPARASDELSLVASTADWEKKAAGIRQSVEWMLGDEPAMMPPPAGRGGFGGRGPVPGGGRGAGAANPGQVTPDLVNWVIQRGGGSFGWLEPQKSRTTSRPISFGFNVRGDLYYPADTPAGTKLPTVIWLHGYSYQLGYMWVYHNDLHPILALVRAGYAVLAYDQSGFGSRMSETGPFYDRYPRWSRMGRMVEDARAAIDALQKDSLVDAQRIYLFGYSMGGAVGLYTAALDPRVKGVVSICGFTPMRTDTAARGTGGVARYSYLDGLIPRLGFFVGHESQIPYDFHELLALIAPRPVMAMQPQLDRDATPADVHQAVEQARKVYSLFGASDKLALYEPWDYNRLPEKSQDHLIEWMAANMPAEAQKQDEIRLNQIQVIGSHNSYHAGLAPSEAVLLRKADPKTAATLDYRHPALDVQLANGIRQLELDIFADSKGGRYANPAGLRMVSQAGLPADPPYDPEGLMKKPGFKVLHMQDIDYRSNCQPFTGCLGVILGWSKAHPGHLPIFILVESKEGEPERDFQVVPEAFTPAVFDAVDQEIRSVFPRSAMITPDDVRGQHSTLEEAILASGWPNLESARGKFVFLLDQRKAGPAYLHGHPSLKGRVMFTNAEPGSPDAAFVEVNDPLKDPALIPSLVRKGYLVRTRTDAELEQARAGDVKQRDAALSSGAQILSTDFPFQERATWTGYAVSFPEGTIARCNPVAKPSNCTAQGLAEPK